MWPTHVGLARTASEWRSPDTTRAAVWQRGWQPWRVTRPSSGCGTGAACATARSKHDIDRCSGCQYESRYVCGGMCARLPGPICHSCANRLHPYAAPIECRRLMALPAAFIASAENDPMHVEAEKYAAELIAVGVPTTVTRYGKVAHNELASRPEVSATLQPSSTRSSARLQSVPDSYHQLFGVWNGFQS